VVACDIRDDDLLSRRHAEQVGMQDQVVRVLVVALVADVVSNVVKERGVGKEPTVVGRAADALSEGVEQAEREALNGLRVECLVMAPFGELANRAVAGLARIGDCGCDARRLEQQALADSVTRDEQIARVDASRYLGGDSEPRDDDVGALRVQSGHCPPLIRGHRD
jgi:hypothetical protein